MPVIIPTTLDAALHALAERGEALTPMAGCTDLLVFWPSRVEQHERHWLDLSGLNDDLRFIRWSESHLEIGALTTYWDVIADARIACEFPMLIESARQVGAIQIQARGTWAGNIANASPAADGVPALMAYDASVLLSSRDSTIEVPLDFYYLGYKKTVRRSDQLITSIRIPRRAYEVQSFHKIGPRRAQAIAKIGLAISRSSKGWRIVASSMAPVVKRCANIERALTEQTPMRSSNDFLPLIERDVSPIDDIRSTSHYRMHVMSRVLFHALRESCPWIGRA